MCHGLLVEDVDAAGDAVSPRRVHEVEACRHERGGPTLVGSETVTAGLPHADEEAVGVVPLVIRHGPNLNKTHRHVRVGCAACPSVPLPSPLLHELLVAAAVELVLPVVALALVFCLCLLCCTVS